MSPYTDRDMEEAVIRTLAFFDIFEYPITLMEAWKWLSFEKGACRGVVDIETVRRALSSDRLRNVIDSRDGFFFFKGKHEYVEIRKQRYNYAERKFRKALRISRLMRYMPYVRMIGICNSLAYANSQDGSDIDFFIITAPGRAWLSRHYAATLAKLLHDRPSEGSMRDTICLSFFLTSEDMDLRRVSLKPYDIYMAYWINQVYPIYDQDGTYRRFLRANGWTREHLPNVSPVLPCARRRLKQACRPLKRMGEAVSPKFLDKIYREIQIKVMPKPMTRRANIGTHVVIDDTMLKLHVIDNREKYRGEFEERLGRYL